MESLGRKTEKVSENNNRPTEFTKSRGDDYELNQSDTRRGVFNFVPSIIHPFMIDLPPLNNINSLTILGTTMQLDEYRTLSPCPRNSSNNPFTSLAIWSRAWSSAFSLGAPRRRPDAPGLSIVVVGRQCKWQFSRCRLSSGAEGWTGQIRRCAGGRDSLQEAKSSRVSDTGSDIYSGIDE